MPEPTVLPAAQAELTDIYVYLFNMTWILLSVSLGSPTVAATCSPSVLT